MKVEIRNESIRIWQERWNNSENGRLTWEYFSNIEERLKRKEVKFTKHMLQVITGHGEFPAYKRRFGFADSATCWCGEQGTVEHRLTNWPMGHREREEIKIALRAEGHDCPKISDF